MPLYVVTYTHPDEIGWQAHLPAHIGYLQDLLAEGRLLASGPVASDDVKSALLILSAGNERELRALIARDPFAVEGLIENMTVSAWDPIFGAFNDRSSIPGRMQTRPTQ